MLFSLIQMKVVTSNLEQRSFESVCKRYREVLLNHPEANHTRDCRDVGKGDPKYCTEAGKRDMYDYNRAHEIFNYVRELIGLTPVPLSKDKQIEDEMMKAVIRGSRGSSCETKEGRRGLSSSTTNFGNYELVLSKNVWFDYFNAGQPHVPVRRQLINPALPEYAADALEGFLAIRVRNFNSPPPPNYKNPEMITFPSPGYFPGNGNMYSYPEYWSIVLRDYDDLPQDAEGDVICNGKSAVLRFSIGNKTSTIPKGAFLFIINRTVAKNRCVATIKSKQADTEWRFWTEFVDCTRPRPTPIRTEFPEGMKVVSGDTVATLTGGSIAGLVFGFIFVGIAGVAVGLIIGKRMFTTDDDIIKAALV